MKKNTILFALTITTTIEAMASQPLRRTVIHQLTDGTKIEVTRRGGPDSSWWESKDGRRFQLTRNVPGTAESVCLIPCECQPSAVTEALTPLAAQPYQLRAMSASTTDGLGQYGVSGRGMVSSIGCPQIPVIMVAFSDKDFLPTTTIEKIDRFFNEKGYKDEKYAIGSVADYFEHSSYSAFRPKFEVVGKVTLSHDYRYYGAHSGASLDAHRFDVVREAVQQAEAQGIDFSKFATDGQTPLVSILFAGPGEQEDYGDDYEDYLWAHFSQSTVTAKTTTFRSYLMSNETMRDFNTNGSVSDEYMTGIGTFCHEFGHALGLPDIYDVDGDKDGAAPTPGYWDVMDYQFMYDGYRPMEYSVYERAMMGWIPVTDLGNDDLGKSLVMNPVGSETLTDNVAYRITNPVNSKEFFLFENRQANAFYQANFLGEGMLVWHINYDETCWENNTVNTAANAMGVRVVPADGFWQTNNDLNLRDELNQRYTFTGDLFPGYTKANSFDASVDDFLTGSLSAGLYDIKSENGIVSFTYGNPSHEGISCPTLLATPQDLYDLYGHSLQSVPSHGLYILGTRKHYTRQQ